MRVLNRHVTVCVDGEEPVLCGPGPVPDRIAALITFPGVFADDQDTLVDDASEASVDAPDAEAGDVDEDGDEIVERPDGRASRDRWAAYAESLDIDVTDDMDKATIRAAVEAVESGPDPDEVDVDSVEG